MQGRYLEYTMCIGWLQWISFFSFLFMEIYKYVDIFVVALDGETVGRALNNIQHILVNFFDYWH